MKIFYERTHQARKRFGQNFLQDKNIIDKIVRAVQTTDNIPIIEIGPGLGALTEPLLLSKHKVSAIEIDRDLAKNLRERFPTLNLIEGDALDVDINNILSTLGAHSAKIVGNLPYNISTPLIFHFLQSQQRIESMYFMLQREVVDRMAAIPGSKDYGKLSIMTQYHCDVFPLFNISPHCFHPVPKVDSTFVQLKPKKFHILANNQNHFELLVSTAFQQRRKTLRNAIKILLPTKIPPSVNHWLSHRAEEISIADYIVMSNDLEQSSAQAT